MHRLDQVYFYFVDSRFETDPQRNSYFCFIDRMQVICVKRSSIQIWRNEPNLGSLEAGDASSAYSDRAQAPASAACPARAARPGGPSGGSADLADPLERIHALFDIERDINDLSAEKRLAARREEALRGTGICFKMHERLA